MQDSRHNARILALQKVFEAHFHSQNLPDITVDKFSLGILQSVDEIGSFEKTLYAELTEKLPENQKKIDSIIAILAPDWPIDKIAGIDLQILRLAILEGFILKITPERVAIDEAIELTKEFSNDQSRKFVSGVLGNLIENKSKYLS